MAALLQALVAAAASEDGSAVSTDDERNVEDVRVTDQVARVIAEPGQPFT